ncbi:hypothetical protein N4T20_10340 [Flavobacterium sp. TR2]|uniref:hypothetical protein n=1 Tax=Flavobacterium sp. TR2 TaxID=2977321 RepID=UPI0021B0E09A|nr:hypothetical protein [Flavobacterium sp. TR2]UWY30314.1 hypothetical protein N4T20_10340 [Flavobacterium sp. TR2]
MVTDRTNIGYKFEDGDIPSQADFQEVFNSFIHKDEDKADFQMVEDGRDNEHYVTPALLYTGLQNIGIITGNCYMPYKEQFDGFIGNTLPLRYAPVKFSVKAFKNGQLLFEKESESADGDYIVNYDNAVITFSANIDNRNIEVAYWYKNLTPNPGGGTGQQIDFTSFLHTSGNETKNGILTFNNTTPTSTSGIVLTNSGADAGAKVLDVTVSGAGSGVSVQNTASGTGIKLSNTGAGVGVQLNSSATATGDALQVTKDNVVKAKINSEGTVTAKEFVSAGGQRTQFVKGDGFLDPTAYADDTTVIHTTGNESKDGALKLTHNNSVEDVLTITKNNSANCLKLVQNSPSNATTSTFDTNAENVNRKAISVQKIQVEKAFITHDGNVSGTSFTTLNEKADITDGLLTLAPSESGSPTTATAGHAKLYAKTNGTTDLYVMGSDGVEKKIGENSLQGVLLTSTDQSFTGIKSVTNTGNTQTNGLVITNNGGGGSNSVSLTNNGDGIGLKSNNTSTGFGIYSRQTGEGGHGIYAGNSTDYGYGLFSHNTGNGTGIFAHTEFGSGNAISAITSGDGIGILSTTSYDGICIAANAASGATGLLYVGKNNGVNTFTVDKTGDVKANSFVKTGGTSSQYLMADGSVTTSTSALPEPSQITITTSTNITTDTLDTNGKKQLGKNVIINNGASAINITVNGGTDFCASYLKHGAGAITFVQAAGRTLVQVNASATLNGAAGSTATISSIGTTDYLRISNM